MNYTQPLRTEYESSHNEADNRKLNFCRIRVFAENEFVCIVLLPMREKEGQRTNDQLPEHVPVARARRHPQRRAGQL